MYTIKVIDEQGNENIIENVLDYHTTDKYQVENIACGYVLNGKLDISKNYSSVEELLKDVVKNVQDLLIDEDDYPSAERLAELIYETVDGLIARD